MSNQIDIPAIILEHLNYPIKIVENNERLYFHIDYLRNLVKLIHHVYCKLSKKMIQLSEEYERKVLAFKNASSTSVVSFIKSIGIIHINLSHQLSNNTVALGSNNHKIVKHRHEIIKEKMYKIHELTNNYLEKLNIYNAKESRFRKKCDYFNNYEQDALKYYSLKANSELYQKLSSKQLTLRKRMEELYELKNDMKIAVSELRISIREYFEMEKSIISEYSSLLLNVRKSVKSNRNIYEPIIEENSDYQSSVRDIVLNNTWKSAEREKNNSQEKKMSISICRKEIIKDFQKEVDIENFFQDFMTKMEAEINQAGQTIDEIRSSKQYNKFNNDKLIMLEIIPLDSIKDIDQIISEISLFRQILLNLNSVFKQTKVLKELKRYRRGNLQKFIAQTTQMAEQQKKSATQELTIQFKGLEDKFQESHQEYMKRFRQKVLDIQKDVLKEYSREELELEEEKNRRIKNNLFQKKYYQIMMLPFFLNIDKVVQFQVNPFLIKFQKLLNATKMQNITLELNSNTLNTQGPSELKNKSRMKIKTSCCGLIHKEVKMTYIDEYHCALKDGLILIKGKLKMYQQYFSFKSFFNPKTLFGYSDLRIPKWDIIEVVKGNYLFFYMVIVVTTHGKLEFTSFISNPIDKFMELFDNRHSGISTINAPTSSELQTLEIRFQRSFQWQLKKKQLFIDKLSTYLSDNCKNLSVSIQYRKQQGNVQLFQIKIVQLQNSIEYFFIHEEHFQEMQTRNILEEISKDVINKKDDDNGWKDKKYKLATNKKHSSHPNNLNYEDNSLSFEIDSCSIIETRERNKFSFIKQPSFLQRKDTSFLNNQNSERLFFQNFMNNDNNQRCMSSKISLKEPENLVTTSALIKEQEYLNLMKLNKIESPKSFQQTKNEEARQEKEPTPQKNTAASSGKDLNLNTENYIKTINLSKCIHGKSWKNVKSSHTSSKRQKSVADYKNIFIVLGAVLVVNLIIRFFKY